MIKAKFLILDFINLLFELSVIAFFVFYIVLGDRFEMIVKIVQSYGPLLFFYLFFSFGFRFNRSRFKKFKTEFALDEILIYLSPQDILKDRLVIFLTSVFIVLLPYFSSTFNYVDILQGVLVFAYLYLAHFFIFRSKDNSAMVTLNNYDKIKDQVAIYFLPFLMFAVALVISEVDKIDIFQSVSAFLFMMLWHFWIFKKE